MPYFIYLLKSEEGYHYIGQTEDLNRRLSEHNFHTAHLTKHGNNWRIIYTEEFYTCSEAMKREKWLKNNIPGWSQPKADTYKKKSWGYP